MKIVVAIGGNMISDASKKGESYEEQVEHIRHTAHIMANLIEQGHNLILTHGNGPQVGSLLKQQDVKGTTQLPLKILGAMTQGLIGVTLQHELINELSSRGIEKKVVVIPTTVLVDAEDPGFQDPSKPIGKFFSEEEYSNIPEEEKKHFKKFPKGYRKVVPSPRPMEILENGIIELLSQENIVIAVGGGGSPTIRKEGKLHLVDAVIDKDLASSLLARQVGADLLLILTNIDGVYRNFNKENQELITQMTVEEANILLSDGQLGEGSMKPKVRAAIEFSKYGETIITSPDKILESLKGESGTRILRT